MNPTSYDALQLQGRETVPKNLREWCSWCEIEAPSAIVWGAGEPHE